MATDAPALDPRIEEVLRDIAADPRAKLFTCDVERMVRGLGSAPVHASLSTAGLTSAERHLLTIGREEVARLFLFALVHELESAPGNSFTYVYEPMQRSEWRIRAARASKRGFEGSDGVVRVRGRTEAGSAMTVGELLQACLEPPDGGAIKRTSMVAASLRLLDRPTTRVYAGIDLMHCDRHQAARRILLGVLEAPSTPEVRHHALVWHGMLLGASGSARDATAEFIRAATEMSSIASLAKSIRLSVLNAIWFAVKCGALSTLEHLSELSRSLPTDPGIDAQFVDHHRKLSLTGATSNSRPQSLVDADAMRALADSVGGTEKEVVYAALG